MKKKFFLFSISLILVSVIITSAISINSNIKSFISEKEDELHTYCRLINSVIKTDYDDGRVVNYPEYADSFSKTMGLRLTFIDQEGNVLADSVEGKDYIHMENHLGREEVIDALLSGSGVNNRQSKTLGEEFIYVAHVLEYEGQAVLITRVAMHINKVQMANEFMLRSSLMSSIIGIIVAVIIALIYTNKLISPIKDMERQLAITMEENKKAENIRKEFVANVTHELKTPLTSIAGFVETLQEGAAENPEVRRRFLDIVAIEAARLRRLIEDLLIISDIENKRETNTDTDINVKESIEEILTSMEPVIQAKNIKVVTEYAYEMYIGGNNDRFKQLMMNLIDNAIKYSYEGGTVTIISKKIDGKVYISVKDEGIGMDQGQLSRIFERFYRIDKSRSQKIQGTGLGLSIVKHIAALFEAEIKVDSSPGKGSTFTVIFNQ
ncbi:MAG: sensor histidine kinase [Anaerovoracaceae bacterium]